MRKVLIFTVIGFCVFCGLLVVESGLFGGSARQCGGCILLSMADDGGAEKTTDANDAVAEEKEPAKLTSALSFGADNAESKTIILGAADPNTEDPEWGYKFQLELSSRGAAIGKATFSDGDGKGFDNRDPDNPRPLVVFSPIKTEGGGEILSMANSNFVFDNHGLQLPLDRLHWKVAGVEKDGGGSESVKFEALIKVQDTNQPAMKLTKTYTIQPGSYLVDCSIVVENLLDNEETVHFKLQGPGGFGRESFRTDMRKVIAGYKKSGEIVGVRLDKNKLRKAGGDIKKRRLVEPSGGLLWAAAVNKYFAAILVPEPDTGRDYCDWITDQVGSYYDPDGESDSGDENISLDLTIGSKNLAAKGSADSSATYKFQLYVGPKDKSFFDKNEMYRRLGFVQTIDFIGCCCPASIIKPLAFGILAIMKAMYGFIGNYGVVIIILVFCVRLILHPITKKSQVSMSKMQKLAPKAEEIKKKYANNKAEMNKQMMALYREQGASPIMGFLPMMIQMPIWIALWSAVYASIDLRGARFLPFWITDLSMPDAAYIFPKVIVIPLIGWKIESLNLLPLMMGVAFYLQQKLMPKPASSSTNPQVAQQQKMMMIMMPLLFPLMLYKAPSGVNLYIMSSTFAGVIEQYVIRKHIREKEEADSQGVVATTMKTGGKLKKKKPKPFFKT
ncbi:MAG: YidC/Oxa1 family insertase periplasmic-domain containing protein [Sedimentisphaerales bacterium]|nr:YidC/Oxa1 family insertase periplasmic-domain containing protein [Sedimentisphaerales bacterium]